jgi:hypothetical protein
MARAPGSIRDAIVGYLSKAQGDVSLTEIREAVTRELGDVSASSVRSYLNLNVPETFERTTRGHYRLKKSKANGSVVRIRPVILEGRAQLFQCNCFEWLAEREPSSIHAVVTDPPYGLVEYTEKEQVKLRNGKGGSMAHSPVV